MLKLITTLILTFISISFAQNCGLIVPADPLTAQGLATPYILTSLDPANPCSIINTGSAVFVEATILDNDNGNLFVYHPLVVDNIGQIAVPIVVPEIPIVSTIGLWFGANGDSVTLIGTVSNITGINSLQQANCVNGLPNSNFGQFAYCNAVKFFNVANRFINVGLIKLPPIGNTLYGVPCPNTRHFGIVDQDQSDNVISTYIITTDLKIAQNTAENRKNLNVLLIVGNGSDNRLVDVFVGPAIGCESFKVPDLADPTLMISSLALNELFASQLGVTNNNVAIVPSGDPMCLFNDAPNLQKLNLYRQGVNQPVIQQLDPNNNLNYCNQMSTIGGPFLALHSLFLKASQSPDQNVGDNLFNFLANRFVNSWAELNCLSATTNQSPITVTLNANGVAIANNINTVFGAGTLPLQTTNVINTGIPLAAIIVVSVLLFISIILNIFFPIYYSNKKDFDDKLFMIIKKEKDIEKNEDEHEHETLNTTRIIELN